MLGPAGSDSHFRASIAKQSFKKKKKKVSLSNIDSQNHKHKLRFERGQEPKNKKIKKTQIFFFGELSPQRLYL